MAWTLVQAAVKLTSQSNGDDRFSTPGLQNPWADFDET